MPHELLIEILALTLSPQKWIIRDSLDLALVCWRWRGIVLGSDRFWLTISGEQTTRQSQMILEHNASGPLRVSLPLDGERYPWDLAPSHLAIEALRWTTIIDSSIGEDIEEHLHLPLSSISEIYLSSSGGNQQQLQLGEGVPVRILELGGISMMNWESNRFAGLEILRLCGIDGEWLPSLGQVWTMLALSPKLQRLGMACCYDRNWGSDPAPIVDFPRITLRELKALGLSRIPSRYVDLITRHIDAPHLEYLHIGAIKTYTFHSEYPLLSNLQSILTRLSSADWRLQYVEGHYGWKLYTLQFDNMSYGSQFSFNEEKPPYGLEISFLDEGSLRFWQDLAYLLSPMASLAITMTNNPTRHMANLPTPVLDLAWRIRCGVDHLIQPFLDHLARHEFPRLTVLEVSGKGWTKDKVIEGLGPLALRTDLTIRINDSDGLPWIPDLVG